MDLPAEDRAAATVYSPPPMDGRRREAGREPLGRLEDRLAELERLAEELEGVSEGEAVGVLDRAVALLAEVNAGLESRMAEAEGEARELGALLKEVGFGAFDAALEEVEDPSGPSGSQGGRSG